MKKSILSLALLTLITGICLAQPTVDLNGVTYGFGAGPAYSLERTYDYSLTTDAAHNLKLQPLSKGGFAIATVLMVKLGKESVDPDNNMLVSQSKKSDYANLKAQLNQSKEKADKAKTLKDSAGFNNIQPDIESTQKALNKSSAWTSFGDHLSVNLALNLADVSSNVTFNKNINGGIGLGYFLTSNLQLALFFDVSQVSQLRDYVVSSYQDKPIPNGAANYTSLSTTDNNLFYNKTISGLSLKLIFSLGNEKSNSSATGTTPPAGH